MGFLLPTLSQLQEKLKKLEASCKVCRPLLTALQTGIQKRFREVLQDPELIAAVILLSKFRTCWTTEEVILKAGLDYIRNHLEKNLDEDILTNSSHSNEDDFFASMKSENLQAGELERQPKSTSATFPPVPRHTQLLEPEVSQDPAPQPVQAVSLPDQSPYLN
ncbi:hypothetical protein AOLI_G00158700 [Acnodon oligacanthus]